MKAIVKLAMTLAVLSISISFVSAQNQNSATSAYMKWKENFVGKLDKNLTYEYVGIGIAVSKSQNKSVEVRLVVGSSPQINKLGSTTFTVQPVKISNEDNQNTVQNVGNIAKLQSPEMDRAKSDEIIYKPQITAAFPDEANGVRISIIGMDADKQKPYTFIVPVNSGTKTAALGKITSTDNRSSLESGKCFWFTGYCEGSCSYMCVGCSDNSPILNCVNCSMTCANGETCTPSGPKPVNCP